MCLNYAVSAALSHEKIRKNPQRITKIRPFVDQCKWKEMNFSAGQKTEKSLNQKNKTIVLNVLLLPSNSEGIAKNKTRIHFKRKSRA